MGVELTGTPDGTYLDGQVLTVGEANVPRVMIGATVVSISSGVVRLGYFTATKTETCGQITSYSGTQATSVPTLCRMGVYSVAANGDLTLLAACANDTTIWSTTATEYTRALTSSFSKVKGQRYALGAIAVATAAPNLQGMTPGSAAIAAVAPRLTAGLFGQTDLPASISAGALANSGSFPFMTVTP